ncbi:MAG: hypothetical protein JWL70_1505 [Acidimicrobiia bacterium]|nr:hypothetical protein [Acidimicrobiia bacterium]
MIDEQLKHDLEPLVRGGASEGREEWREQEGPGDAEPVADQAVRPDLDDQPMGLVPSQREIEARSELARWLPPHVFPARRAELLDNLDPATPPEIIHTLRSLPDDRLYETVQSIWVTLGHPVEGEHTGRRQDAND